MTTVNVGKHLIAYSVVCDEDIKNAVIPQNLADVLRREYELQGVPVENAPANIRNPLVIGVRLNGHVTGVYEVVTQIWFNNRSGIDLDILLRCFINAWNRTVGSRGRDYIFPGSYRAIFDASNGVTNPDYSLPLDVIRSGSQYTCASAISGGGIAGGIVGLFTGIVPVAKIYQVTYQIEHFGEGAIPVWGVGNWYDRLTMSDVLITNQERLLNTTINPLTVSSVARETATEAGHVVVDAARGVADGVRTMVPDNWPNILPISNNEFQMIKNVAVVGGLVFGGVLLFNSINRATKAGGT